MTEPTGSAAWLEGLLRDRLGPDAALGTITFEGRLLHVDGARLPLGGGAVIDLDHVTLELGAGPPLGWLPLSARLVALRAGIRASGRTVSLTFAAIPGHDEASWVHGTLHLSAPPDLEVSLDLDLARTDLGASVFAGEIRLTRAGGAALTVTDVSVSIDLDRRGLRYRDLRGVARGARFAGWGRIPFARPVGEAAVPLAALRVEHVGAALLADVATLSGVARSLAVPPDLVLDGELMVRADRAVSGSFAFETPRSALVFHLTLRAGGELLGSTLRGRFAAADAMAVGLSSGVVRPQPADVLAVDARLSGTLARPGVTGRLSAARLSIEVASTVVVCDDASVLLDVDADRLTWHRLAGRVYGGQLSSSGRLGWRAGTLDATLAFSGVRVEDLPGRSGSERVERALATVLRGAASGELRFEREGAGALAGRGRVTVTEPVYFAVREVAPALERYGLPIIPARGTRPISASVRFERGELIVEPLSAAVDGIDVDGALRLGPGGRLDGRVRVRLLDGLLHGSRVREAVKGVLDSLSSTARAPRKRR